MKQLESGLKRTIHRNNYQPKLIKEAQNRYLDYLIDPGFKRVNRLFVLWFENKTNREVHSGYIPKRKVKDCNAMIDGGNFFDQSIKMIK